LGTSKVGRYQLLHREFCSVHDAGASEAAPPRWSGGTIIMADLLLKALGQPLFTWGNKENLTLRSKSRINHLAALRLADKGDLSTLLAYART